MSSKTARISSEARRSEGLDAGAALTVLSERDAAMRLAVEAPTTKHEWVVTSAGRLCVRCREFQKSGEFDDTLECPSQPRSSG
jgi:hypothetical protein